MPPTIHIIRHGQAAHNIAGAKSGLVDPELTPEGREQCAELRAVFPHHAQVKHVVASPMARAVQTALLAVANDDAGPLKLLDTLQEVFGYGSSVDKLRAAFGDKVDLSMVRSGWTNKDDGSPFDPEWDKVLARSRDARQFIRELASAEDAHVAVVTHGALVHFLTEDWEGLTEDTLRSSWANCEYRSYQFVDPTGQDSDASLRETVSSWQRRKGDDAEQPSEILRSHRREEGKAWIARTLLTIKNNPPG
ncbi:hypothetical protein NQ176_g915 [Zarea fungicola]|uniref:Uncharacterized protein n=1 Tax=Zarea fungicola TaxID=93591 RepID=A0ACC1NV00_9HYPO|nr:hypothetical protein NQ176_g915 [Lecanicillium fungicola]